LKNHTTRHVNGIRKHVKVIAKKQKKDVQLNKLVTIGIMRNSVGVSLGTAKKMLSVPSMDIYVVKEVPIYSRENRKVLKEWLFQWNNKFSGTWVENEKATRGKLSS
jgi:hypothetical protein